MRSLPPAATLTLALALLQAGDAVSQQPSIFYVYDDLNRLIAVIDQQGNAATYTYDAVGNILRIDRFDAAPQTGPVRVTLVSPSKGRAGTEVQIFGTGFSPDPSRNSVTFTGAAATITDAVANRILTSVPNGAVTGTVSVTAPLGTATSATIFQVIGPVTVTPTTATVFVTRTVQLEAQEDGAPTTNVTWSVNDLPGGDASVGTISPGGLYAAPALVPTPAIVTVTATHTDDPTDRASAAITIVPPEPVFLASAGVSLAVAEPRVANDSVTASVSAAFAESSVSIAPAPPVSVALAPVVTAVAPATATAGRSFTLTLRGRGFLDATDVRFLSENTIDGTVTAASIAVSSDGTQLTADVSIAPGAVTGARVVQVTTLTGASTAAPTGGNLFTVE